MEIWAVANQKGGVGKTTTVAAMAGILMQRGYRVLMLDCDPQASLTSYFGIEYENLNFTIFNWYSDYPLSQDRILDNISYLSADNISLVPASVSLTTLEKKFAHVKGMGLTLKRTLAHIQTHFDYVLIDCPPVLGLAVVNALAACNHLIIPVQTEFLATKGLERMVNTVNMVLKAQRHSFDFSILPTMFDRRTRESVQALRSLREKYGRSIWPGIVPIDTKFRDASRLHQTPSRAFPKTRGVDAYEQFTDHLISGVPSRSNTGDPAPVDIGGEQNSRAASASMAAGVIPEANDRG